MCRDPTLEIFDMCEFKMALFDNGKPEEFLLFIQKYQDDAWLIRNSRIWCEASISMYSTVCRSTISVLFFVCTSWKYNHITFQPIHFGFRYVIFPMNRLSKKNFAMCHRMSKPHQLKVRCYTACIVDIHEYLAAFPG